MNATFPIRFSHLAVVCALCLGLAACHKAETTPDQIRPALAYKVGTNAGMDSDVYPGEIRARHEADHAFRIGGKMVSRLVEQGSVVSRGQALARLDPQDVKLAADAATANVNAAASAHVARWLIDTACTRTTDPEDLGALARVRAAIDLRAKDRAARWRAPSAASALSRACPSSTSQDAGTGPKRSDASPLRFSSLNSWRSLPLSVSNGALRSS